MCYANRCNRTTQMGIADCLRAGMDDLMAEAIFGRESEGGGQQMDLLKASGRSQRGPRSRRLAALFRGAGSETWPVPSFSWKKQFLWRKKNWTARDTWSQKLEVLIAPPAQKHDGCEYPGLA